MRLVLLKMEDELHGCLAWLGKKPLANIFRDFGCFVYAYVLKEKGTSYSRGKMYLFVR